MGSRFLALDALDALPGSWRIGALHPATFPANLWVAMAAF
jgi:hypothetical protein